MEAIPSKKVRSKKVQVIPSKKVRSNQNQKKQANSDARAQKINAMKKELEKTEVRIDQLVELLSREYAKKKGLRQALEKEHRKALKN
ncbi:unnamed protein product [Urochloa humidicola]